MTRLFFHLLSFSPRHTIIQAEKYLSKVKTSKCAEVLLFISNLQLIPELLENDNRGSDTLKPEGTFTILSLITTIKRIKETHAKIPTGKELFSGLSYSLSS